ncbi:hypothetical protein ACOSP7_009575 [Xanthoceras sorbifolium]
MSGFFSPKLGEFLALREGLSLALQNGLTVSWCDFDSSNVVKAVNGSGGSFCAAGPVIDDIKALFKMVGISSYLAIPRSKNGMAYSLASLALSSIEDRFWLGERPCFPGLVV